MSYNNDKKPLAGTLVTWSNSVCHAATPSSILGKPSSATANKYHDYAHATVYGDELDAQLHPNATNKNTEQVFPLKLHYLLSESEADNLTHVISWRPHGRCFAVLDQNEFVKKMLPLWFQQSKYASFQRQLNLYGFKRLTTGPDKGCYYHELFLRGKQFLCRLIKRTKIKGTTGRKKTSTFDEPNFYALAPLPSSTSDRKSTMPGGIDSLGSCLSRSGLAGVKSISCGPGCQNHNDCVSNENTLYPFLKITGVSDAVTNPRVPSTSLQTRCYRSADFVNPPLQGAPDMENGSSAWSPVLVGFQAHCRSPESVFCLPCLETTGTINGRGIESGVNLVADSAFNQCTALPTSMVLQSLPAFESSTVLAYHEQPLRAHVSSFQGELRPGPNEKGRHASF